MLTALVPCLFALHFKGREPTSRWGSAHGVPQAEPKPSYLHCQPFSCTPPPWSTDPAASPRNLLPGICAAVVGEKPHYRSCWGSGAPALALAPRATAATRGSGEAGMDCVLKMAFSSTVEVKGVLSTGLTLRRL